MYEQSAKMAKQMLDMQRTTVEGTIGSVIMFWDQTGNMMNSLLTQTVWMPEEGKKSLQRWIEGCKTSCEAFKGAVSNCYGTLEKCLQRKA
jgi:hypothetical protein